MTKQAVQMPEAPESRQLTVRPLAALPVLSAEQYQHLGRYAGATVLHTHEAIGGAARMADWADQNPTDFYTKIFTKIISRSQHVDVSGTLSIDDAISKLERDNNIREGNYDVIDAAFEPVHYDL